jgi:hypothetical protein
MTGQPPDDGTTIREDAGPDEEASATESGRRVEVPASVTPAHGALPKQWTRDALVATLLGENDGRDRPLSSGEWQETGLLPTVATCIREFGSWNASLEAAGLTTRASSGLGRRLVFDLDACVEAVARFLREPQASGQYGAAAYAAWAGGRTDVPSLATVRNRATWNTVKAAAADRNGHLTRLEAEGDSP